MKPPYTKKFALTVMDAALRRDQAQLLFCRDRDGVPHAGAFVIWDNSTLYYLIGGGDERYRDSQAGSLCIWEAIKIAAQRELSFDFEGSMIEPIEKFFRGFGAQRFPYHAISRVGPLSLSLASWLKQRRSDLLR